MASQVLLHAHENLLRAHEAGATRMFYATLLVIVALHPCEKITSWPKALQVTSFIF